jgi:hypothetical protein
MEMLGPLTERKKEKRNTHVENKPPSPERLMELHDVIFHPDSLLKPMPHSSIVLCNTM